MKCQDTSLHTNKEVMSRINESLYEKELEAQKKRVQALKYLENNGCGPTTFENDLSTKGVTQAMAAKKNTKTFSTDNTLEQIRKEKGISGGLKTTLLEQQVTMTVVLIVMLFVEYIHPSQSSITSKLGGSL